MARRELEKRHIRALTKIAGGASYSVTLPIDAVRKFKWRDRQKLVVEVDEKRKRLVIKDWKK
tara:strand:- start:2083 stop:2268 length:186 start_codon:yes stop_codon:yes gene_type:complete